MGLADLLADNGPDYTSEPPNRCQIRWFACYLHRICRLPSAPAGPEEVAAELAGGGEEFLH